MKFWPPKKHVAFRHEKITFRQRTPHTLWTGIKPSGIENAMFKRFQRAILRNIFYISTRTGSWWVELLLWLHARVKPFQNGTNYDAKISGRATAITGMFFISLHLSEQVRVLNDGSVISHTVWNPKRPIRSSYALYNNSTLAVIHLFIFSTGCCLFTCIGDDG